MPPPADPAAPQPAVTAFGGRSGLVDTGLPSLAFVLGYTLAGRHLGTALVVALAVAVVLAVLRLVRRDRLQHVLGGVVGVVVAAYIARHTGRAADFYLPGLFVDAGGVVVYAVANVVRWPVIGLIVGTAAGWGVSWRAEPALLRAFTRASWVWVAMFATRLAVEVPLYLADRITPLGVARVALGVPAWLVVVWVSVLIVRAATPAERWHQLGAAVGFGPRRQPAADTTAGSPPRRGAEPVPAHHEEAAR